MRFNNFESGGDDFQAYLVDRNESIYTFRNELYRPEGFSLKKTDLLFAAEMIAEGKIKTEVSFNITEMITLIG